MKIGIFTDFIGHIDERAIKLYEKVGFHKEGIKEKSMLVDGKYIDEYYMAKLI
jgi:RimJ/RimL family protein N-acetyltransferase